MDFPKRIKTHISEKSSLDLVSKSLPKEWIIREMTERDYGIDLYVEIVKGNGLVTGDLVALQVKTTEKIHFSNDVFSLGGIKRSTLNYWTGLPVPVFVLLVSLSNNKVYWCNIAHDQRCGHYKGSTKTFSLSFNRKNNTSKAGIALFILSYIREKKWPEIESAIEKCLMSYPGLGPLLLICSRRYKDEICSTAIQYHLIQNYEYYTLLSKYLLNKEPKPLSEWYERNREIQQMNGHSFSLNFCYATATEMLKGFIREYRKCIIYAYELVTAHQRDYFMGKMPYLVAHLDIRPHTFVMEDWYPRYYFDEYENETQDPEKLFFEDFNQFDSMINEMHKS
ncbi:hypothetical protein CIP106467_4461 [Citrobacter europaeus]|uniref:DUF4365 domain-containing protein n=1 Tax=Citrobacter europaeus TaxID=1914243 RepID=UPI00087FD333|nr:DUF4365 domain-containing protein [Citrobacter europaeus]UBI14015.1 DUF4365 domain-containing protein [Citrobacter europaeus]CAD7564330.1 hypothetical protein CIP106467_4461 [Citrobacter europaeus]